MSQCATCRKPVQPRGKNPSFPFCSERCRQIDLGKWLNEEHRIAGEPVESEHESDGASDQQVLS